MKKYENIFINGSWVKPQESNEYIDVINPVNEEIIAKVVLGSKKDVDIAAKAAKRHLKNSIILILMKEYIF